MTIFRDSNPPPPIFFFNYRPIVILRYAETQWCKIIKKILLIDGQREIFNIHAFNILVKLHNFVCRPRRVAAEILIKINEHIYPCIYDFPYILPLIKPTLKGPTQQTFPNILVITILSTDVFIKMV